VRVSAHTVHLKSKQRPEVHSINGYWAARSRERPVPQWEHSATGALPVRVSVMAFYYLVCFAVAVAC
jgi:hypothetical protein